MIRFRRQDPATEVPFDAMVSLGRNCRPAYQIARSNLRRSGVSLSPEEMRKAILHHERIAFRRGAFFFDWLITPFPALIRCIAEDFARVFDREAVAVAEHGLVANRDGIVFFHGFPKGPDGRVLPASLDALYAKRRAKFDHLATKTLGLFSGRRHILYIRNGTGPDEAEQLADTIASRHPDHRFHVLLVVETGRPKGLVHRSRHASVVEIDDRIDKPAGTQWQGNDEVWGAILDRIQIDTREWPGSDTGRAAAE